MNGGDCNHHIALEYLAAEIRRRTEDLSILQQAYSLLSDPLLATGRDTVDPPALIVEAAPEPAIPSAAQPPSAPRRGNTRPTVPRANSLGLMREWAKRHDGLINIEDFAGQYHDLAEVNPKGQDVRSLSKVINVRLASAKSGFTRVQTGLYRWKDYEPTNSSVKDDAPKPSCQRCGGKLMPKRHTDGAGNVEDVIECVMCGHEHRPLDTAVEESARPAA